MRAPTTLLAFFLFAGCHHNEPSWATSAVEHRGEATITGEPLAIGKLKSAPVLDGKLDNAAWADAAVLGPLVDPGNGAPLPKSPVAAFARLGWTDDALWLGVVVHDRDPVAPFGRDDVDPHVWGKSSGIEMMLQPGDPGDNRDYYELQVDVGGAVFDSHFDDYNAPITGVGAGKIFGHQDWSSGVERASFVQRGSFYSIEAKLPWKSIAGARVSVPPKPGDVWRLNLYSFRDGQRFALAWSPLRGQGNLHRTARFGRVRFTE